MLLRHEGDHASDIAVFIVFVGVWGCLKAAQHSYQVCNVSCVVEVRLDYSVMDNTRGRKQVDDRGLN